MEMELRTPLMPKNLCRIITAILYLLKKGFSKNIPWYHLHTILKRQTKLAGKAIGNLLLDHHQTLSCRPHDIHTTFISPIEYQFSCSSTPLFNFNPKRKNTHRRYSAVSHRRRSLNSREISVANVRKAFDYLNSYEAAAATVEVERSPLTALGFGGGSRNVRQLRVTDSPFPVSDVEEDGVQVDMMAEEFINKFYLGLKRERNRAAADTPSPFSRWGQVR